MASKLKASKQGKKQAKAVDERFVTDERFGAISQAGPSKSKHQDDGSIADIGDDEVDGLEETEERSSFSCGDGEKAVEGEEGENDSAEDEGSVPEDSAHEDEDDIPKGIQPDGFAGPSSSDKEHKTVKPLTPETLAAFKAKQERTGVIYISRIPPGMRPTKVRHLMSAYGEIGRVYLQQEDPKRTYLRKKFTSTKKPHYTEGWVEFMDKRVARSVAGMLNAQPIGGKKGSRWRDDVWTMKYLPKFKWGMLTEQITHEAAVHAARLRVELEQSRKEQREYLKHVELARVLDKRKEKKRKIAEEKGEQLPSDDKLLPAPKRARKNDVGDSERKALYEKKRERHVDTDLERTKKLDTVLGSIF